MLHVIVDEIQNWLGIDDDIVTMGLMVLILGAIANILTLDLKVRT